MLPVTTQQRCDSYLLWNIYLYHHHCLFCIIEKLKTSQSHVFEGPYCKIPWCQDSRLLHTTMDHKKRHEYSTNTLLAGAHSSPILTKQADSNLHSPSSITSNPIISILAYCAASISMTIINKFCVSGKDFNLNFFFLAVQVFSFSTISSSGF